MSLCVIACGEEEAPPTDAPTDTSIDVPTDTKQPLVFTDGEYTDEQGVKYHLNKDGSALVIDYTGTVSEIVIPNTVNGYTVKAIGDDVFSGNGCFMLKSIQISNNVMGIGAGAFSGCDNLQSITLPFVGALKDGTSNTHFGYIFDAEKSNSDCVPNSLKTVVITGGTSIDDSAFCGCSSLTSIVIPASVISIGSSAFFGCSSLTSIEIPDGVMSIDRYAFSSCSSLTNIVIPASVTSIGSSAFTGWMTIYAEVAEKPAGWDSDWNSSYDYSIRWNYKGIYTDAQGIEYILHNNNTATVSDYTGTATEVVIPKNVEGCKVTAIENGAFRNCSGLTSITFADPAAWYMVYGYRNWQNQTGGTRKDVTNPSTNATYFKGTYYNYYWYKK